MIPKILTSYFVVLFLNWNGKKPPLAVPSLMHKALGSPGAFFIIQSLSILDGKDIPKKKPYIHARK